jgi:hypothetical protein
MICHPREQSAAQIGAAIGASRATTNMRVLLGAGLVGKRTGRGERTTYFGMEDDAWQRVIRQRIAALSSFRQIADDGLRLLGPDAERSARLRDAERAFTWMAAVFGEASGPEDA